MIEKKRKEIMEVQENINKDQDRVNEVPKLL